MTRHYKRGDPDPTPRLNGRLKCPASIKVVRRGVPVMLECTWPDEEHDPYQHVAAALRADGSGYLAEVWDV